MGQVSRSRMSDDFRAEPLWRSAIRSCAALLQTARARLRPVVLCET